MCLDVKSLLKVLDSCLVKRLCVLFNSQDFVRVRHEALAFDYSGNRCITEMIHNPKQLYLLYKRYKNEFPDGTPFVCACREGRVEDVNQFLNLHRFHAYIDVGTANAGMDVTAMVSEVGTRSDGVSSQTKSWFEIISEKVSTIWKEEEADVLMTAYKYEHIPPETLEQLYYRLLFDGHFPKCETTIPYFWMPRFVEATDSSARTLKMYKEINYLTEI